MGVSVAGFVIFLCLFLFSDISHFSFYLQENIRGFKEVLDGKHDDLPDIAFFMVGDIEEACQKGEKLIAEAEARL
jgi:F0F1-type ATP synthase beta subunit